MARKYVDYQPSDVEALILRALIRKLLEKGVLSEEDVCSLLSNAVMDLHLVAPDTNGPKAANDAMIEGS